MALTLEDITDGFCRMPAIMGSAYFTVNGGAFGSAFAFALGTYAVLDSFIYGAKMEEIENSLEEIPKEDHVKAKMWINDVKLSLAKMRSSCHVMGALYGTMYAHQGYVHDDLDALIAGGLICMGYSSLFLKSNEHLKGLEVEQSKARGQAIYTKTPEVNNDRRTKTGKR